MKETEKREIKKGIKISLELLRDNAMYFKLSFLQEIIFRLPSSQ